MYAPIRKVHSADTDDQKNTMKVRAYFSRPGVRTSNDCSSSCRPLLLSKPRKVKPDAAGVHSFRFPGSRGA